MHTMPLQRRHVTKSKGRHHLTFGLPRWLVQILNSDIATCALVGVHFEHTTWFFVNSGKRRRAAPPFFLSNQVTS